MNLGDYPALSDLALPAQELSFERAIWGKVNGAATDFRWIARSQGFQGHRHGAEKALLISREERPRKCFFWRRSGNCFYAVCCYPSQAKDRSGRSGFLEKQIVEYQADSVPAALAALLLLPLVARFQEDLAVHYTGDPRWEDENFVLSLESSHCAVMEEHLVETIAKGRKDLLQFRDLDLEFFFEQLETQNTPAFLPCESPLSPEAIAVLLLPFTSEKACQLALGGWIPSGRSDADAVRNWDGLACDISTRSQPVAPNDGHEPNRGRRLVRFLRDLHPSVRRLLDFADSPRRWSENLPGDLSTLLNTAGSATTGELEQVKRAIQRVQQESQRPSGLAPVLEDARRIQLHTKANILRAAYLLLSPTAMDLERADSDETAKILRYWRDNAGGELISRIDLQLAQLQNSGSRG